MELNRIILTNIPIFIEAVTNTCSVKNMFLEILQNSQENTCDRVSCLIKLQASGFPFRTLTFQFWLLQLFIYNMSFSMATSTTWTQTLDPDPGTWTRTLDPDPGPGSWKPGPWKTWTLKNLYLYLFRETENLLKNKNEFRSDK